MGAQMLEGPKYGTESPLEDGLHPEEAIEAGVDPGTVTSEPSECAVAQPVAHAEGVIASAAMAPVMVPAADEEIISPAAVKAVATSFTSENIVPSTAFKRVSPESSKQCVPTFSAEELIVSRSAEKPVVSTAPVRTNTEYKASVNYVVPAPAVDPIAIAGRSGRKPVVPVPTRNVDE